MIFVNSVIRVSTKTKVNLFPIGKNCTPFMRRSSTSDVYHLFHTFSQESFPQKFVSTPGTNVRRDTGMGAVNTIGTSST